MPTDSPYPAALAGERDSDLSRWLWLVKCLAYAGTVVR